VFSSFSARRLYNLRLLRRKLSSHRREGNVAGRKRGGVIWNCIAFVLQLCFLTDFGVRDVSFLTPSLDADSPLKQPALGPVT
jgi:hypothetical protein